MCVPISGSVCHLLACASTGVSLSCQIHSLDPHTYTGAISQTKLYKQTSKTLRVVWHMTSAPVYCMHMYMCMFSRFWVRSLVTYVLYVIWGLNQYYITHTHTKLSAVNHLHHFKDDYMTVIQAVNVYSQFSKFRHVTHRYNQGRWITNMRKPVSLPSCGKPQVGSDVPQVPNKLSELKHMLFVKFFMGTNVFH